MDNLTHSMVGVAVARSGLSSRFGAGTTAAMLIGSNLPDVDVLWPLMDVEAGQFYRRMLTHSVVGLPILVMLAAWMLRKRFTHLNVWRMWAFVGLGAVIHVFLDLWNSFGVVLWYPLNRTRVEFEWVYIIDGMIWLCCLLPWMGYWLKWKTWEAERGFRRGLAILAAYVALSSVSHAVADRQLRDWVAPRSAQVEWLKTIPEAMGPHRFRGLVKINGSYEFYLIHSLTADLQLKRAELSHEDHPSVRLIRESPLGRELDWFYLAPVWEVKSEGGSDSVEVHDLRFDSFLFPWQKAPYGYRFHVQDGIVHPVGWCW